VVDAKRYDIQSHSCFSIPIRFYILSAYSAKTAILH
jgi:hypothetical protein